MERTWSQSDDLKKFGLSVIAGFLAPLILVLASSSCARSSAASASRRASGTSACSTRSPAGPRGPERAQPHAHHAP